MTQIMIDLHKKPKTMRLHDNMAVNTVVLHGNSILHNKPIKGTIHQKMVSLPGTYNGLHTNIDIDENILSKHTLLIGGTGTGKTNALNYFIDQLKKQMTANDVMIIFDTKGDFEKKFYRNGDVIIGNSQKYNRISDEWNIYKEIAIDGWDKDAIQANISEITYSLFKEALENTNQQFFPSAARDLFAAILEAHIRAGKDDINLKKLAFNNAALKKYLERLNPKKIVKLLSASSDLASVLSYIGDGESNQALGVIAEMQNVVRKIFIGAFAKDGRFSVREFVRKKGARTLFIEYDMSMGETLTPIYRLLFDLALKEAMGRSKSEGSVYLVCDEFKLLPNLQHIEDGVNFGRGLGVKIFAGIQSIEQLYEMYGESKGKNIAAGFSSVFAFKANDSSTRDFISELYGKNIVLEQYKTSNNTMTEEKREGKTVEDWHLNSLQVGQAVVGLPFSQPFIFNFDEYKR